MVTTFEGGSGITTTVTDNKVSITTDGAVVTETSTLVYFSYRTQNVKTLPSNVDHLTHFSNNLSIHH